MAHDDNDGQSTAAWTGVAIMLVAAAAACWGVFFGPPALLWIGVAVFLVGALVWYGMEKAGMGVHKDEDPTRSGQTITPPDSARGGRQA